MWCVLSKPTLAVMYFLAMLELLMSILIIYHPPPRFFCCFERVEAELHNFWRQTLHLFFVCFLVPHPPSATLLDLMTNDSNIATDHLFAVLDRSSAAPADPKASNLLNLLNSSCLSPSFLFQRLQLPNDGVHKVTLYFLNKIYPFSTNIPAYPIKACTVSQNLGTY